MTIQTENLNILWASLIVEELVRQNIDLFCISPGSRSTPLTVAVARHHQAKSRIFYDERAAAYFAVGYARATGKVAPLIATSGTAMANYLPAVVEASADFVPMLILSADRPPELRQTGANQTIIQPDIYGNYVRWQFDLPCPDEMIPPSMVLTTVDQACYRAHRSPAGPVHLNCMFREPLAPIPKEIPSNYLDSIQPWLHNQYPFTEYSKEGSFFDPNSDLMKRITGILEKTQNGLIVFGQLRTTEERVQAVQLAERIHWPVFADVTSGLRLTKELSNQLVHFDLLLLSERFKQDLKPETILHIGRQIISKRFLQFVEKYPPENYILVRDDPERYDPFHGITLRLEADVAKFCHWIAENSQNISDEKWVKSLLKVSQRAQQIIKDVLKKNSKLNEPEIARIIARNLPGNWSLFLANSLPIREVDMFASLEGQIVPVISNRGASGIDGNIATACGYATGSHRPVTLLIGDLAFLHDLNSLMLISSLPQPIVIVLLNNQGGGIFSFLPIAQFDSVFEKYFATPHNYSFEYAARMFGIEYTSPKDLPEFSRIYRRAISKGRSIVIEVRTHRDENFKLHQLIQQAIVKGLDFR